jgi:D-serine deaminase-like pyridoxal phosphate-dependent protein
MVRELRATTVDPRFKGFAPATHGRRLASLIEDGVSLFDGTFSPPLMVLKSSALGHNIATMAAYCRGHGVDFAPHGKTTLAPQLFARQLAAGAWGISVATPAQVALCRAAGVPRVLLANELVDPAVIAWIIGEMRVDPGFDFLCYIDSVEGVRLLGDGLARSSSARPFDVLVEMGPLGGRTGCRTLDEARAVVRAASRVHGLRVVGVAGYEGGIGHELTGAVFDRVRAFLGLMRQTAQELANEGLLIDRGDGIVLSAGGSVFFDDVVAALAPPLAGCASRCILRAGAYVSHDAGHYAHLSPFTRPGTSLESPLQPALEAWGHVLSTPEPRLAIVGVGRRDVPFDLGMPIPQAVWRPGAGAFIDARPCSVRELNDQHAFVEVPAGFDLRVGDWLSFGISHPCTAFDKWHLIPEVDEGYRIVDFIETYF